MDPRTDLLVEIGTEELPPIALPHLSAAFADGMRKQLDERAIGFSDMELFAAPRRLALLVRGVATRQPDVESLRRGPAITAAFAAGGSPTKAAEGFARSCGVTVEELTKESSDRGEWLAFRSHVAGRLTAELAPELVERALADLPIPRRMRWGAGEAEFVRPVHWVCLMLGQESVQGKVLGLTASNRTFGHRFHSPGAIVLSHASEYSERLREGGFVEASFSIRRERIRVQVEKLAAAEGLVAEIDQDLLDEVTALVEWPKALLCSFEAEFLAVPPEVLIETMRKNQKYFPLRSQEGQLQPLFVAVSNIESRDETQVRAGNERVIRPRFTDAKFFWDQDRRRPLEDNASRLESLVFQDKLGTVAEKSRRVARVACTLAELLGESPELVERAAKLAKCDLVSSMVYEFPSLQGTMGRYYAELSDEHPDVSGSMEQQYWPRFAGDKLPTTGCARILGIADRLDSIVGIFGIGQRPSGAKDPYGLRRASIAVLRILIETPLGLDLRAALQLSAKEYPDGLLPADTPETVFAYMLDRLTGYYQEQDIGADTVDAVLACDSGRVDDLDRRIRAVHTFRRRPEAASLAAANKRIRNILAKATDQLQPDALPEHRAFFEPAESELWNRVEQIGPRACAFKEANDYAGLLEELSALKEPVDRFFDKTMVMVDEVGIRVNRLLLLRQLHRLFLQVADIGRLQVDEQGKNAEREVAGHG